jgi:hypothetical protein
MWPPSSWILNECIIANALTEPKSPAFLGRRVSGGGRTLSLSEFSVPLLPDTQLSSLPTQMPSVRRLTPRPFPNSNHFHCEVLSCASTVAVVAEPPHPSGGNTTTLTPGEGHRGDRRIREDETAAGSPVHRCEQAGTVTGASVACALVLLLCYRLRSYGTYAGSQIFA